MTARAGCSSPPQTASSRPELVDRYAELSPDGRDHLPVVVEKFGRAAQEERGLSLGDLERITSSTLVMGSDDDIIHLEHTIALYRGIGRAQLVVVPGTSHLLLFEKPELCVSLVADFLTGADPKPLMTIRRM
jgi:pimeloyl-ACP methyl ester carboxylesterase